MTSHIHAASITDLFLDKQDHTGQPQHSQSHSHRLLVRKATALRSKGAETNRNSNVARISMVVFNLTHDESLLLSCL